MPDITFTNEQTVHVAHALGATHPPVYVEAEGTQRLVEVVYGTGFFDVMFGRVMTDGLVSYSSGTGTSGPVLLTQGSIGGMEDGAAGQGVTTEAGFRNNSRPGWGASGNAGNAVGGSFVSG